MDRLVCPISGHVCYDSAGVRAHLEVARRLKLGGPGVVHRCPQAVLHPGRPYHVGVRRNLRRAA